MTPLPPSSTPRYFCDYVAGGYEHTFVIRANATVSPAALGTILGSLFLASGNLFYPSTLITVRWAPAGSNVTNPVTTGAEGLQWGTGTPSVDAGAFAINFIGRSSGGKRVRLEWFGYSGTLSQYRLHIAESAALGNMLAVIQGEVGAFLAIDGIKPQWYDYANVLVNAYWQRKIRA